MHASTTDRRHAPGRVHGRLTDEDRARHAWIGAEVEEELLQIDASALARKAELLAIRDATASLRTARHAAGLMVAEVAERSGLAEIDVQDWEAATYPQPDVSDVFRLATAIGVRLTLCVADAA